MKKMVLKMMIEDGKSKRKAFQVVAAVEGWDSVAVEMKEIKMIVIGNADPMNVTAKLRKSDFGFEDLVSIGPAKAEKKEEKKEEEEDVKKEEKNIENPKVVFVKTPWGEENPNSCGCTIC